MKKSRAPSESEDEARGEVEVIKSK